jgi:Interferon regulatory factor transcription factor
MFVLLQEWARNTGRWSEGDPTPYFAQLKTRLRCAFNKAPDIEEMKDYHSRNCEEPFKVYRFTTRKTGGHIEYGGINRADLRHHELFCYGYTSNSELNASRRQIMFCIS